MQRSLSAILKGQIPMGFFFFHQGDLEAAARSLDLDTDFSDFHANDPGKVVFDAVAHTGAVLVDINMPLRVLT